MQNIYISIIEFRNYLLQNVSRNPTSLKERVWEYHDAKYNTPHCKI